MNPAPPVTRIAMCSPIAISPATPMHTPLRVLQLGPLYNNHLRRWSQHAVTIGACDLLKQHAFGGLQIE